MKKRLLFLLFIFIFFDRSFGQSVNNLNSSFPVSSQELSSAGVATAAATNVDLYTGRMNYAVKLKDVSLCGINIPLGVYYTTSGFKVQDVSGNIGLGWGQNFTGLITRAVQGIPDESSQGYCGSAQRGGSYYGGMTIDLLKHAASNEWDSEPDKFYFSILGISGSFVLDPDGNPVMQSTSSGIKITSCPFKRGYSGVAAQWILTDQLGTQYYLGEASVEVTSNYNNHEKTSSLSTYTSAWYINKIVTNTQQQINFTYTQGGFINYTNYVNVKRTINNSNICSGNTNNTWNEDAKITFPPLYLSKITGQNITIAFEYDHDRLDLSAGKGLTDIRLIYNRKVVNHYIFDLGYFTSDDGTNSKRLKLNGIKEEFNGFATRQLFTFYYNEQTNLPARNSLKSDYWGYYNNNAVNSDLYGTADKSIDQNKTKANILVKAINLLGGGTYFEYEQNDKPSNVRPVTTNEYVGGLRIKKTYEKRNDSETAVLNQLEYAYNQFDGQLTSLSSGAPSRESITASARVSVAYSCTGKSGTEFYYSSAISNDLYDDGGPSTGYSNVTIKRFDGSSVRYKFSNASQYPDQYESGVLALAPFEQNSLTNVTGRSFYPATSYAFARGKILLEETTDINNQVVKRINYNYSLSPSNGLVYSIKPYLYAYTSANGESGFTYSRIKYFCQELNLDSKIETFVKDGIDLQSTTKIFTYTNFPYNLLKTATSTISAGKTDRYLFRYPFEIIPAMPTAQPAVTKPLSLMAFNNIVNNPIEVIHTVIKNGISNIVSESLTTYKPNTNNVILPFEDQRLELKAPILESSYAPYSVSYDVNDNETGTNNGARKSYQRYSNYDSYGNITEKSSVTQPIIYNSCIYGYDGMYKIADISNAQQINTAYTSFECVDKGNWVYTGAPIFDLSSVTGNKLYNLSKGSITKSNLSTGTIYIITYWTKNTDNLTIPGTQGTPTLLTTLNGWRAYQHTVTGVTSITISGSGFLDELRLFPLGAKMTTYTYEPLVGLKSKTNENNRTIYYEYDEFSQPKYIKDNELNIVQAYCYNFNGEPGNCFTSVTNQTQSRQFYKDDCGPGVMGLPITYSVPAGRYSAGSQQAANGLAQVEIDQNGQDYANANGTCSGLTLYARIEMSNLTNDSWSSENGEGGSSSIADIYIKFYSDSQGTNPYSPDHPITVIVTEGFNLITAYNGSSSGSSDVSYAVAANQSSLFLGRHLLSSYGSYIDPYSGSGLVYESNNYTYDLADGSNNYVPF
jgi:hypothetical protein